MPRGRLHRRPLTSSIKEGFKNWLRLTILPTAIRRLATFWDAVKGSRTWEGRSCWSAPGNDGDSRSLAGFTQRATKASPGQKEGLEQAPAASRPWGPLLTVGDLLQSGRWPDLVPPATSAPFHALLQKWPHVSFPGGQEPSGGLHRGGWAMWPVGRPEEESFRAGLPLHHGHVPADLHPAAIRGGERERGRRQGQWLSSASCQNRGPGRATQTPSTALVLGWGLHTPEGGVSLE